MALESGKKTTLNMALAFAGFAILATPSAQAGSCDLFAPPAQTDTPDSSYTDSNGDGIDGMRCGPIFVSPNGSPNNLGTIDSPLDSINAAIQQAKQLTPVRDVYIAAGDYDETLVLEPGVGLYGGYDHTNDWSRSSALSRVEGTRWRMVGAWATKPGAPIAINQMEIVGASQLTGSNGVHSVGIFAQGAGTVLNISDSLVSSGWSRNGSTGIMGATGANGTKGYNATQGDCDTDGGVPGGGGGASPGGSGYRGGDGGFSGYGDHQGGGRIHPDDGEDGWNAGSQTGGWGGSGGQTCSPGTQGSNGLNGPAGDTGTPGAGATAFLGYARQRLRRARWLAPGAPEPRTGPGGARDPAGQPQGCRAGGGGPTGRRSGSEPACTNSHRGGAGRPLPWALCLGAPRLAAGAGCSSRQRPAGSRGARAVVGLRGSDRGKLERPTDAGGAGAGSRVG